MLRRLAQPLHEVGELRILAQELNRVGELLGCWSTTVEVVVDRDNRGRLHRRGLLLLLAGELQRLDRTHIASIDGLLHGEDRRQTQAEDLCALKLKPLVDSHPVSHICSAGCGVRDAE